MKGNFKKLIPIFLVLLVALGVLSAYSKQMKKQTAIPEVRSVESLSQKEKEAFDLCQTFGEFYYLDKNITLDRVKELRTIFSPTVQEEIGLTDDKIEGYVKNVQDKNNEIEFVEARNPIILKSEGNNVILSVDLYVNVISSDSVKPTKYEETVTIGVEDNIIMAFKAGDVKEVN